MTDLRQAAQQVLDAWDDPMGMKDLCVAMDAIRTALEQQAEPLTDDEIIRASNALVFTNLNAQMQYIAFARAIEAKLKEKNSDPGY